MVSVFHEQLEELDTELFVLLAELLELHGVVRDLLAELDEGQFEGANEEVVRLFDEDHQCVQHIGEQFLVEVLRTSGEVVEEVPLFQAVFLKLDLSQLIGEEALEVFVLNELNEIGGRLYHESHFWFKNLQVSAANLEVDQQELDFDSTQLGKAVVIPLL